VSMELRCENNRKFAELDPASLSLMFKCQTCSTRDGVDVYHPFAIADLLHAVTRGDAIIRPCSGGILSPEIDTARQETGR
jgi:hypothetical protein